MMGHEKGKCEVCRKSLEGKRMGAKYCTPSHRQWAYNNRKRIARKQLTYLVDPDATADLKFLESISKPAADMVRRVASLAGRDIASDVLGGVWDVLVKLDVFEKEKVADTTFHAALSDVFRRDTWKGDNYGSMD